jgi:hypothetical protein
MAGGKMPVNGRKELTFTSIGVKDWGITICRNKAGISFAI